jgi:hypothetical protein
VASPGVCNVDMVKQQVRSSKVLPHLCGHDSVVQLAGWGCEARSRR